MRSRRRTAGWGVGAMVLVLEGLELVNYGLGVTPTTAAPPAKDNSHLNVTQKSDKNLPSTSRFTVLTDFGGAAVRDERTGLVWERTPDTIPRNWVEAISYCVNKTVEGMVDWRLPSLEELQRVLDPDPSLSPLVTPGGVFPDLKSGVYWSATSVAKNSSDAWLVALFDGHTDHARKAERFYSWCVRGGMNADAH